MNDILVADAVLLAIISGGMAFIMYTAYWSSAWMPEYDTERAVLLVLTGILCVLALFFGFYAYGRAITLGG